MNRPREVRGRRREGARATTIAIVTLLLAASLLAGGALLAPGAMADSPPEDPGHQGQGDDKRPEHAANRSSRGPGGDHHDRHDPDRNGSKEPPPEDDTTTDTQDPDDGDQAPSDTSADEPAQDPVDQPREPGRAPTVSPSVEPAEPQVGQVVHLDAGAVDPDGTLVAIDWFLPHGVWLTGQAVTHVFERPGNVTVELIATDDQGHLTRTILTLHVRPAAPLEETATGTDTEASELLEIWRSDRGSTEHLPQADLTGSSEGDPGPAGEPTRRSASDAEDRPYTTLALIGGLLAAAVGLVARAE